MIEHAGSRFASGWLRAAAVVLAGLAVTAAAAGIGQWRAGLEDRDRRRILLQQVTALSQAVPHSHLEVLSFSPADAQRPPFRRLRGWFAAYRGEIDGRGIWSLARRAGQLVFGPAAHAAGDPRATLPGTLYRQPPDALRDVFETGRPAVIGPYTDEFGTFISAVAPVSDPRSVRVELLVGIDVAADRWQAALKQEGRRTAVGAFLLATIGLGGLWLIWRRRAGFVPGRFWSAYAEAVGVALGGVVLTVFIALAAHHSENRFRRDTFNLLARAEAKPVLEAFANQERYLGILAHFFSSSEHVDRAEFGFFTRPLVQRFGIQSFAWIHPVSASEKERLEARARAEGIAEFALWQQDAQGRRTPVSPRPRYYPVWYAEPGQNNRSLLGYDMGAAPAERAVLQEAAASGLAAAVETPSAEASIQGGPVLTAVQAVFRTSLVPSAEPLGYASLILRPDDFLAAILAAEKRLGTSAVVGLYEIRAGEAPRFVASSDPVHSDLHRGGKVDPESLHPHKELPAVVFPLFVFDRSYVLAVYPQPAFMAAYPRRAGVNTAIAGILFTGLLTVFTVFILSGRVRLETEVKARTAELRLKSLVLDQIRDHVTITDLEGTITYANRAVAETLGRAAQDLKGRKTAVFGEDPEQGATQRQIVEKTLGDGVWRGEVVNIDTQGRRHVMDCRTQTIQDADGSPLALCGVATEITERKQAEATLRELKELHEGIVQTMNEGIILSDAAGIVTFINPELATLLDWAREDMVGRSWMAFVAPEHQERARAADARRAAGQTDRYEIELQRRDGTRIPVLVAGTPRCDPHTGQFAGCLGVFTDIRSLKQAQEERELLRHQLLQAQKMESVGRLAGGVAHDYNNMLTVIIGYAEMALERVGPEDPLRADLLEILRAARHSADITRQLLGFARKQPIRPRVLDLNATVEGMLKMLRRLIGEDINLSWRPGAGLWPVRMDPIQIDQVLANLCVNARDAISGVGRITIVTQNARVDAIQGPDAADFEPGDFVLLTVRDDGCGMAASTLERLFEPFFSTKPFGQGTGLGLATVYGIIKQNNGFIEVESQPGQGAVFRIYLPRQEPEAPATQARQALESQ